VMAIYTISISLDSSEESVGAPSGRVFWLGRIPTTVPVTTPTIDPPVIHDDTSLIPTETPTISPITSTIPPTAPTTHYTSPFIHTNPSDDDTPDTPPSPTHEIPPVEPIPYGRPYRYHPNGPVHMMTARKRVGPLPTHRLVVRHSVDYSSSDYFTSDYSSRDLPSDSSSEMPSDSSSDALSDSSSSHSSLDHSSPTLPSGALSYVRANLLPPRKRIRSPDFATDLEDCSDESYESSVPRETSLRDAVVVRGSDEPYLEPDIDPRFRQRSMSVLHIVTPPFLHIAAEANLGYYFKGHVGSLEDDEEGLLDVLVKLETSFGELFCPCDAAAKQEEKGRPCAIFKLYKVNCVGNGL
ncbi:hypothetical protein Tco_1054466, partial [Tanacetum coccineum]